MRISVFFFFNDTATTEIYTLSLHDALPISHDLRRALGYPAAAVEQRPIIGILEDEDGAHPAPKQPDCAARDRKSTRLNSSHANISYAVFCLNKKNRSYSPAYVVLPATAGPV